MVIWLAPLVMLIGLLAYALSSNGKVSELGRVAFACGLLVSLFEFAGHAAYRLP